MTQYVNKLKEQKKSLAAILIAAIDLFSIGGTYQVFVEQWTTVVYESNGVIQEIGVDWLFCEFTGPTHPDNIHLTVGCEGSIVGGTGGSVLFNFNHRRMTFSEYLQLSDTEHEEMFESSEAGNYGHSDTFSSGWGGPINYDETYVWVLRFLEVGGLTEGTITISFRIIIRAV